MDSQTPSILAIDDELDNRYIIAEYLEDEDYDIHFAEDGAIAWDLLQNSSTQFNVILLDIMMPNMNGLELLQLIKGDQTLSNIPVILQTAKGSNEDIVAGIKAGAFYYLTKPYDDDVLISIVETAIRDQQRLNYLHTEIDKGARTFGMMKSGVYEFRNLEDGMVVVGALAQACPDPGKTILGLSELVINAVEHGNLGITYSLKSELLENNTWEKEIERRLSMDEYASRYVMVEFIRQTDKINFVITDQGDGFDWQPFLQMDAARGGDTHGRGIAMAGMLSFDLVEYQGKGNQVVATLNL